MSGRRESWTPERRAAQAERMRKRFADPEYRQHHAARMREAMADPERRAGRSQHMRELNERMRTDVGLKGANLAGIHRSYLNPSRAEKLATRMTETMTRPQMRELARAHAAAADHCAIAERRWRRVRGGPVPAGSEDMYAELRRQVGAREALRMVRAHAAKKAGGQPK